MFSCIRGSFSSTDKRFCVEVTKFLLQKTAHKISIQIVCYTNIKITRSYKLDFLVKIKFNYSFLEKLSSNCNCHIMVT